MSGDTHELGQVAYEAYGKAVDWTAYNGQTIAQWADQDPIRQHAWSKAADAVRDATLAGCAAAMLGQVPSARRSEMLVAVARCVEKEAGGCCGGGACGPEPVAQICGQGGAPSDAVITLCDGAP